MQLENSRPPLSFSSGSCLAALAGYLLGVRRCPLSILTAPIGSPRGLLVGQRFDASLIVWMLM